MKLEEVVRTFVDKVRQREDPLCNNARMRARHVALEGLATTSLQMLLNSKVKFVRESYQAGLD